MVDFKKTLTNLHNQFPEFDLDTLFKIVDAIVETSTTITVPSNIRQPSDKPWWLNENSQTKITNEDINKWTDWKSIGVTVDNPYTGSYIR